MNQEEVCTGNIYIENGIIQEMDSTRVEADEVIARDMLVLPGLIQVHVHLYRP